MALNETLPDETLHIATPENVTFGFTIAGIGSRFLAALIDTLLILFAQVAINLGGYFVLRGVNLAGLPVSPASFVLGLTGLVSFVILWGYYILFEITTNGQSPGKRWAGLRVVRTDGTPMQPVDSLVRNLVRLVDFMPALYGVGVVAMFIDEKSRRLGDLAAGTLVVHERTALTLESLDRQSHSVTPLGALRSEAELPADLPLERLQEQDLQLIESYLARRGQLANAAAVQAAILQRLAERLAAPDLAERTDAPERLLEQILVIARRRQADLRNR